MHAAVQTAVTALELRACALRMQNVSYDTTNITALVNLREEMFTRQLYDNGVEMVFYS